jgi:prepilin-type N-terminal cleavage/methylation domain-containing protein
MKNNKNEQNGFTLVELVIAVALVGVLSIVALPKITGVSTDARQAGLEAMAAVLTGISTNNYIMQSSGATGGKTALTCNALLDRLDGGAFPAGFGFGNGSSALTNDVIHTDCTVVTTTSPVLTANFTARGVS